MLWVTVGGCRLTRDHVLVMFRSRRRGNDPDDYPARLFVRRSVADIRFLAVTVVWVAAMRFLVVFVQLGGVATVGWGLLLGVPIGLAGRVWIRRWVRRHIQVAVGFVVCLGSVEVDRSGRLLNVRKNKAQIAAGTEPTGKHALGCVETRRGAIRVRLRPRVRARLLGPGGEYLPDPAVGVRSLISAEVIGHSVLSTTLVVEDTAGHRYRFALACGTEIIRHWLHEVGVPPRTIVH
jgi:hypothetical protein